MTDFITNLASSEVFVALSCCFIASQVIYLFHKYYMLKALSPLDWGLLWRSFLPTSFALTAYYILSLVIITRNLVNAALGNGVTTAALVFTAACFIFILTTAAERYEKRIKDKKGITEYETHRPNLEA